MPDRHKTTPLSIRLPDGERQRVLDYAERHGIAVRQVILRAVRELLDRETERLAGNDGRVKT